MNKTELKNRERLEKVKTLVDNNDVISINTISNIGGSSSLYTVLVKDKILVKHPTTGIYKWNSGIPVSAVLARTVTKRASAYAKSNPGYVKREIKRKEKVMNPRTSSSNKVVSKKVITKPTKEISNTGVVTGFRFSFGWGLFKLERLT